MAPEFNPLIKPEPNHSGWHARQPGGSAVPAPASGDRSSVDYQSLRAVLDAAYYQAAHGKGKERHARGNPFEAQHMQTISQLLYSDRGMAFQAIKKLTEGLDLASPEAREKELLGAINYIAGIVVYWRLQDREV